MATYFIDSETVRLVAELLSGLQAPRSLGGAMLGTATEPYDKLRAKFSCFGYQSPDEIEGEIIRTLETRLTK